MIELSTHQTLKLLTAQNNILMMESLTTQKMELLTDQTMALMMELSTDIPGRNEK